MDIRHYLECAVVFAQGSVSNSCGLAMYYPYEYPEYYENVIGELSAIGMDSAYLSYFDGFVSALTGGQSTASQHTSAITALTGYVQEEEERRIIRSPRGLMR